MNISRLVLQRMAFFSFLLILALPFQAEASLFPKREKVIENSVKLLSSLPISYVYGGNKVGSESDCLICSQCLDKRKPKPKKRLESCPICENCSLDCSHFISLVFKKSGLKSAYLTTTMMREMSSDKLRRFHWVDLGQRVERILAGDIVVYPGHVVLVVDSDESGEGSVIHATSGRDVKGGGKGIQLQRNVTFNGFRGPVVRVLRHVDLYAELRHFLKRRKGVRKM